LRREKRRKRKGKGGRGKQERKGNEESGRKGKSRERGRWYPHLAQSDANDVAGTLLPVNSLPDGIYVGVMCCNVGSCLRGYSTSVVFRSFSIIFLSQHN